MLLSNTSDLTLIKDRLVPEKYKGTTLELLVIDFLKSINNKYKYSNNFLNRIDLDSIELQYSSEELSSYTKQYAKLLEPLLEIEYPNILLFPKVQDDVPTIWDMDLQNVTSSYDLDKDEFSFTKTDDSFSTFNTIAQRDILFDNINKFQISFRVDGLTDVNRSELKVYLGTDTPIMTVRKNGLYEMRLDFSNENTKGVTNLDDLVFSFNDSLKLSFMYVAEYERIKKEDITILLSQIVKNKGKLESYEILFGLLNDLGGPKSASSRHIIVDSNDRYVYSNSTKVETGEIYESDLNGNILYGTNIDPLTNLPTEYFLGSQGFYDNGSTFQSTHSTKNIKTVVPFKYTVKATFDSNVFNEYIKPIVHPLGWEIVFLFYTLIELYDKFNSDEILSGDYSYFPFYQDEFRDTVDSTIIQLITVSPILDTIDVLTEKHDIISSRKINDTASIENFTEIHHYDDSFKKIDTPEIIDSVLKLIYSNLLLDTIDVLTEKHDIISSRKINDIIEAFQDIETSLTSRKILDTPEIIDSKTILKENKTPNLVDNEIINDIKTIETSKKIIEETLFTENSSDYFLSPIRYGTSAITYGSNNTYGKFLENNGDEFDIKIYVDYYSTDNHTNLVQNDTIVQYTEGYGANGVNKNLYYYIGSNANDIDLSTQDYSSSDWFNLTTRVPA